MKALLGALLCFVFTLTQAFAISGGPPYPGGANIVGVYAGVLRPKKTPTTCPGDPSTCPDSPPGCSANSLGVFSVGVPSSGIATGTFVMFSQGRVFSGTIQGTADPGKDPSRASLKAVLSASFNFTLTETTPCPVVTPEPSPACTPSTTTQEITASATGSLDAHIKSQLSQASLGAASVRLVGSATIDVSQGQVDSATLIPIITCAMLLKVSGFKQTDTAPTTSSG
jgi:hypothetical protein